MKMAMGVCMNVFMVYVYTAFVFVCQTLSSRLLWGITAQVKRGSNTFLFYFFEVNKMGEGGYFAYQKKILCNRSVYYNAAWLFSCANWRNTISASRSRDQNGFKYE